MRKTHARMAAITALAAATTVGLACAQSSVPDSKGTSSRPLAAADLGSINREVDSALERRLRLREITIRPSGSIALHSHRDRPAVIYVLEGTLTDIRSDEARTYGPQTAVAFPKELSHTLENRHSAPVRFLEVDIFKQ